MGDGIIVSARFGIQKIFGGKKPMAKKYCYLFSEGNANMRELLGGKGANLAEMTISVSLFLRALRSQRKLVLSIMRTTVRSILRSWQRSTSTL